MAGSSSQKAKRQKLILAVMGLALVVVVIYQFFLAKPEPRRRGAASNTNTAQTTATASRPANSQQPAAPAPDSSAIDPDAALQAELANLAPLETVNVSVGSAAVNPRGNIFAYYVKPPEPPPPPPPPPPITLSFVQPQSAVAGTPRKFTLTITGRAIPADAQILLDGRPKPTKRVSDTILSTEIGPEEYAGARNMAVEVKSQSDPLKFYSNPISFVVQASPEPPFKYVGRIGEQGLFEITASKLLERARVGDTIQSVWRIDTITDAQVELTHTQYDIKKRLAIAPKDRQQ